MSKLRVFLLLLTCGSSVHAGPTLQIKNQLQTLSGVPENRSIGSGFMIENGLVVTASHVISPIYPSLPKGTMTVNNVPLTLVCYDNIMDVALLRPDASIPGAQFLQLHNNVKIGMEYIAVYDNNDGIIMPIPHSVGQLLEMPLSLLAKGIVLDIVRANVRNIDNSVTQTDMKFLITGNDSIKPGFSGGPVTTDNKVIGVVLGGEAGSYSILSHVDNLKKLLQRKDCQR